MGIVICYANGLSNIYLIYHSEEVALMIIYIFKIVYLPGTVNCVSHPYPPITISEMITCLFCIINSCFNGKTLEPVSKHISNPIELNSDKHYSSLCLIDFFLLAFGFLVQLFDGESVYQCCKEEILWCSLEYYASLCQMYLFWVIFDYIENWILCYLYVWNLASRLQLPLVQ